MAASLKLEFAPFSRPSKGVLVVFCEEGLKFGPAARKSLDPTGDLVTRAAAAERFKGKNGAPLTSSRRPGSRCRAWSSWGSARPASSRPTICAKLGGVAMGKFRRGAERRPSSPISLAGRQAGSAADLALGVRLRAYSFERYKTKRKEGEERRRGEGHIAVADVAAAQKAFAPREAVANGVLIARDLVNEPANVLYPEEFARRARHSRSSASPSRCSTSRR